MRASPDDALLAEVLAAYPLRSPRVVSVIEASKRNDNLLVEDAGGRCYVLRRYRRNVDEARVLFQLRFQQELLACGYPTSEVLASRSGKLLVRSEAGPWVLFSYIEGAEYDFVNMGQVAEAGRRLAQFHTLSASIGLEEVVSDTNPDIRGWWTHGEEQIAALEALFAAGAPEEIAYLRGWRAELLRQWPLERLDKLPQGWVHSDFHGRNMVFAGEELRGLFDFDPVHRGYWVEDVAHAMFMFARECRGSTRVRPDTAQRFLRAYRGVRPLAADERNALPMMAGLVWVPNAPYHEYLDRDGEDSLAFFRQYVGLVRELPPEVRRALLPD